MLSGALRKARRRQNVFCYDAISHDAPFRFGACGKRPGGVSAPSGYDASTVEAAN
jgi:hypothetical protein